VIIARTLRITLRVFGGEYAGGVVTRPAVFNGRLSEHTSRHAQRDNPDTQIHAIRHVRVPGAIASRDRAGRSTADVQHIGIRPARDCRAAEIRWRQHLAGEGCLMTEFVLRIGNRATGFSVVEDACYPAMYRVRRPGDEDLSDMANLTGPRMQRFTLHVPAALVAAKLLTGSVGKRP